MFDASLAGRPIIDLSSHEGFVASRLDEAKALNIAAGDLLFWLRDFVERNDAAVLSSSYAPRSDMSARVRVSEVCSLLTARGVWGG